MLSTCEASSHCRCHWQWGREEVRYAAEYCAHCDKPISQSEWVARRLYKESFFGGRVSEETKGEANDRLVIGLEALVQLAQFSPYFFGPAFTAADFAAYVHFTNIKQTTPKIYGENMLERIFPNLVAYIQLIDSRPHVQKMMAERDAAMAAFVQLNLKYDR